MKTKNTVKVKIGCLYATLPAPLMRRVKAASLKAGYSVQEFIDRAVIEFFTSHPPAEVVTTVALEALKIGRRVGA